MTTTPPDDHKPLAYDAYQRLAARFAARIDTAPYNAYYERPATLSLLPDVDGLRALDAGCGPGLYVEWLLDHGAQVVGVDASPDMLAYARQRVQDRAEFHRHDLDQPLDFLPDASFDLVLSALVMHYLKDWDAAFTEFARVLKPGGLFVFSSGHPLDELRFSPTENYFAHEQVTGTWCKNSDDPVVVPFYRRPLQAMLNPLADAGFALERVIEPQPTPEFKAADPEDYEKLARQPVFICIRARKLAPR